MSLAGHASQSVTPTTPDIRPIDTCPIHGEVETVAEPSNLQEPNMTPYPGLADQSCASGLDAASCSTAESLTWGQPYVSTEGMPQATFGDLDSWLLGALLPDQAEMWQMHPGEFFPRGKMVDPSHYN